MPRPRLKPLARQIIVLTGATSGIGLSTARLLSARGATLFLIARNEDALRTVRDELRANGGRADYAVADVADRDALAAAAQHCIAVFGRFDTWISDAGAFIYGRLDVVPLEDQRRLFDVTYWGVVHGTLIAADHLRDRPGGGAIVTVGSVLGEMAIPYQGPYCASKFAVKGFIEAFRRETLADRHPISVALIKPASINTAYVEHARNHMGSPGTRNPPPAYHPHLVARAIAYACEHPAREITVGALGGAFLVAGNRLFPRLTDWVAARIGHATMATKHPGDPAMRDNLYEPRADLSEMNNVRPMTRKTSFALEAQLHPAWVAAGLTIAGTSLILTMQSTTRSG